MIKKATDFILSIIAMFLMLILLTLVVYYFTLDNPEYLLDQMEKAGYYEDTSLEITKQIRNYELQSGLPEEVFTDLVTSDMVRDSLRKYVTEIYNIRNYEAKENKIRKYVIDVDEFSDKLEENIDKYIEAEKLYLAGDNIENLNKFKTLMNDIYVENIIPDLHIEKIQVILDYFHTYILNMIYVVALLLLANYFLIDEIDFFKTATFASGVIAIIISLGLKGLRIINNFYFGSVTFSKLVKITVLGIIDNIILFGFVTIVLSFAFILVKSKKRLEKNEKSQYNTNIYFKKVRRKNEKI